METAMQILIEWANSKKVIDGCILNSTLSIEDVTEKAAALLPEERKQITDAYSHGYVYDIPSDIYFDQTYNTKK